MLLNTTGLVAIWGYNVTPHYYIQKPSNYRSIGKGNAFPVTSHAMSILQRPRTEELKAANVQSSQNFHQSPKCGCASA